MEDPLSPSLPPEGDPFEGYRMAGEILDADIASDNVRIREAQEQVAQKEAAKQAISAFVKEGPTALARVSSPDLAAEIRFSGLQLHDAFRQIGLFGGPITNITGGITAGTATLNIAGHVAEFTGTEITLLPETERVLEVNSIPVESTLKRLEVEIGPRSPDVVAKLKAIQADLKDVSHPDRWGNACGSLREVISRLSDVFPRGLDILRWPGVKVAGEQKRPTRVSRLRFAVFGRMPLNRLPPDLVASTDRIARVIDDEYGKLSGFEHGRGVVVDGVTAKPYIYQVANDLLTWLRLVEVAHRATADVVIGIIQARVWNMREEFRARLKAEFPKVGSVDTSAPELEITETDAGIVADVTIEVNFDAYLDDLAEREPGIIEGRQKRRIETRMAIPWEALEEMKGVPAFDDLPSDMAVGWERLDL